MDEERIEKTDEVMLPGFRFHPTDEELVGFYLRWKIQQKPLSIELIKQLDIYKYDPWDLPKLATTGEKEWYFYCPRDRKYRNSTRPNRVTGAGFWKATGTDRPIYSSEGSKCIGLKKSLVFYKGRAAKGMKTDWMMHEFRLPSVSDSVSNKKYLDKNIPANEAWAICRIFKKANSSTQRALSHSWVSPSSFDQTTNPSTLITNFNMMPTPRKITNPPLIDQSSITSFSPPHYPPSHHHTHTKQSQLMSSNVIPHYNGAFDDPPAPSCAINVDASSLLLEMSNSIFGDGLISTESGSAQGSLCNAAAAAAEKGGGGELDEQWGVVRSFPYGFGNLVWDYSSPCPSELSTSYSTNNCYT